MNINILFLSFILYSCIGWIHESIFCSLYFKKHLINRGFLIGPYCPIYGVGSIVCYIILSDVNNILIMFLLAASICCFIEYITGYLMERFFKKTWWDYSNMLFQLHGRICLYGAILFGTGSIIICRVIEPMFIEFAATLNPYFLRNFTYFIALFIGMDFIITLMYWCGFSMKINRNYEAIYDITNNIFKHRK